MTDELEVELGTRLSVVEAEPLAVVASASFGLLLVIAREPYLHILRPRLVSAKRIKHISRCDNVDRIKE